MMSRPAPVGVAILGSTGSIGTSALRVMERQAHRFVPVALTANSSVDALKLQVARWKPTFAVPHFDRQPRLNTQMVRGDSPEAA